jgi:hypothetical protein
VAVEAAKVKTEKAVPMRVRRIISSPICV